VTRFSPWLAFAILQIPVLSPKLIAENALFFMKKIPAGKKDFHQVSRELSDK
jgi:hypothetical protein